MNQLTPMTRSASNLINPVQFVASLLIINDKGQLYLQKNSSQIWELPHFHISPTKNIETAVKDLVYREIGFYIKSSNLLSLKLQKSIAHTSKSNFLYEANALCILRASSVPVFLKNMEEKFFYPHLLPKNIITDDLLMIRSYLKQSLPSIKCSH